MYQVSRILDRARAFHADRIAVVDGDARISYAALGERVDRLVNAFVGLGLEQGDRVAILDWNSLAYLETYYACPKAGLVFLPLNSRLAAAELEYILADAEAKAILVSEPFLGMFEEIWEKAPSIEIVIALGFETPPAGMHFYDDLLRAGAAKAPPDPGGPDDVILSYYTSGTTGNRRAFA